MCLKSLGEYVRKRIAEDGKTAPGRDTTANLIKGLPPDRIAITRKTADGILVGTVEDMQWYFRR